MYLAMYISMCVGASVFLCAMCMQQFVLCIQLFMLNMHALCRCMSVYVFVLHICKYGLCTHMHFTCLYVLASV